MLAKVFMLLLAHHVATAAEGPSFSCEGKLAPDERRICGDAFLSRLDRQLSELYALAGTLGKGKPDEIAKLKGEQRAWLKKRAKCLRGEVKKSDACLTETYGERYIALQALRHRFRSIWIKTAPPEAKPLTPNSLYSKTSTAVYIRSVELYLADPASFQVVDKGLARDGRNVFSNLDVALGADPKTMETLGNGYFRDASHVFLYGSLITGAEPATFVLLASKGGRDSSVTYSKDAHAGYYLGSPIAGADLGSLEAIDHEYARDRHNAYFCGRVMAGVAPANFRDLPEPGKEEKVGAGFSRDDKHVYYAGNIVPGADAKTLKLVMNCPSAKNTYGYAKDAHRVYFGTDWGGPMPTVIDGADAASFEMFPGRNDTCGYARDRKSVFFVTKKVAGADPKTFRDLSPYGADAMHVYYREKLVEGADPKSFSVFEDIAADFALGLHYARDAKSIFYDSLRLPEADPATFKRADGLTETGDYIEAEDKRHSYSDGKIVKVKSP